MQFIGRELMAFQVLDEKTVFNLNSFTNGCSVW